MTHKERRERRDKILEELKNGATAKELSEKYGIQSQTIYRYKVDTGVKIPRRQSNGGALIEYVKQNGMEGAADEAKRLGLPRSYASQLLKAAGYTALPRVKTQHRKLHNSSKVITIISALQRGATANDKWANKFNCTRQYIEQVQRQCEQEGVILYFENTEHIRADENTKDL